MASILMPNQGTVMLWQTFRSTAIRLSIALVQSFRRFDGSQAASDSEGRVACRCRAEKIEASFKKGVLTVTLPMKPAAQKPEKKIEVKAAA